MTKYKPKGRNPASDITMLEKHHSPETKQKISESHKGKVHSQETRDKMIKSAKGRIFSEEHKRNISESTRGRIFSEEHKRNISLANTGRTFSEEHRKKMSESRKGKKFSPMLDEAKQNMSKAHIGNRLSAETRIKLSLVHKGDKSWRWKGGITEKNKLIRTGIEFRLWREAVFARDNYAYQECGDNTGGNLNAHHIKSFSEYPNLRVDISNGITLCKRCHIMVHKNNFKQ